jgi:hypothetical protein
LLVRSLTRHELKEQLQHDQFKDAVTGAVSYATTHRQNLTRGAIAVVVVVLLAGSFWWYTASQRGQRRQELDSAMSILDAQVGPPNPDSPVKTYLTEAAKKDAWMKALSAYVSKYAGTSEGYIAQYYRGTERAKKDDQRGAESDLRVVADSNSSVAPLAKIALANVYLAEKKNVEAQTLLQSLTKDSTPLVSKAQAQILEAQLNQSSNPQAAKDVLKTLDPADQRRDAVKRAAEEVTSDLSK